MFRTSSATTFRQLAVLLLIALTGCAGSGPLESLGAFTGLSEEARASAGLREALEVSTTQAVGRTSAKNGFLDDPSIRIALPDTLRNMGRGLRLVGQGDRVDQLEVAMNRAAERAAGEAKPVFWDAIRAMTFSDARSIVQDSNTAATDYFERTTRDPLGKRFEPIVSKKMKEVGLVRLYDELADRYADLPFTTRPAFDLHRYVTDRALDGLFHVLGEEEQRIRSDPAARVTPLLQKVFGS